MQDEASTSGSDMDDDAMEESGMDAKIAAVLRGTADAKATVQKTKEAVIQLRFRVSPPYPPLVLLQPLLPLSISYVFLWSYLTEKISYALALGIKPLLHCSCWVFL